MSISPYIYYNGDTASATVGTSQAVIPAALYANGFMYDNISTEAGTGYFRIAYATNSSVSTPSYGGTMTRYLWGLEMGMPFDTEEFVLTGLSAGTQYWWKAQVASASTATYYDGLNVGTLTTNPTFTMGTASSPPTADFVVSTTTGPANLAVVATASTTGTPYAWAWLVSNGTNSVSDARSSPTFYLLNAGTYTVTLTVTNADGTDSEVKSNLITVLTGRPYPSWSQNVTSGPRPLTVTYTGTATSNNTSYTPSSWGWALPVGGTSTLYPTTRIVTVTYPTAGTYSATLTATHWIGTGSTTSASAITVYPISVGATFTASPLTGSVPLSVQFIGTPSGDTASAVWNFGDGSATTTANNPTHLYTAASTYTPTYTVYGTTSPFPPTVATSTATGTSWITAESTATYKEILEDLRRQLLLNTDVGTVCTDFTDWGGASVVLKHVYNRVCRLQLETGLLRKTYTTISGSAGSLTLPADLIEIRSVYVDGKRLEKVDARMADLNNPSWVSATSGDYLGWYTNPADHLKLNLVPPVNPSTLEVYYVYAPTVPTVPGDCATANWAALPLPYIYWWVIKYGVLSDLLQQEGDMYDIERAQQCEQLWQEGIEIIKLTMDGK